MIPTDKKEQRPSFTFPCQAHSANAAKKLQRYLIYRIVSYRPNNETKFFKQFSSVTISDNLSFKSAFTFIYLANNAGIGPEVEAKVFFHK